MTVERLPGNHATLLAAVVVLAALSGCAAFPFVGPTCGPGHTDIGAIAGNVSDVHVKGELTHYNDSLLVVDDGTGQAVLPQIGGDVSGEVSTGDCIVARGSAAQYDDGEYEALVVYSELYKEEYVVEDS